MIRFLLTILVSCTLVLATAQTPVVKPLQYKVLIERIIERKVDAKCLKYAYDPTHTTPYGCIYAHDEISPDLQNQCMVVDPNCNCGPSENMLAFLTVKNGVASNSGISNISIANMTNGESRSYYDTLNLYEPPFGNTYFKSSLWENSIYPWYQFMNENFDLNCHLQDN